MFPYSTKMWSFIYSFALFTFYRYITNLQCDQLSFGLMAQLVERCTSIVEVMGLNPVQAFILQLLNPKFVYLFISTNAPNKKWYLVTRCQSLMISQVIKRDQININKCKYSLNLDASFVFSGAATSCIDKICSSVTSFGTLLCLIVFKDLKDFWNQDQEITPTRLRGAC